MPLRRGNLRNSPSRLGSRSCTSAKSGLTSASLRFGFAHIPYTEARERVYPLPKESFAYELLCHLKGLSLVPHAVWPRASGTGCCVIFLPFFEQSRPLAYLKQGETALYIIEPPFAREQNPF